MKTRLAAALALALLTLPSHAGEQVRIYAPDGRSIGTAAPTSGGTTRYYDASGRSTGTSTTTGGTTRYYDASGRSTGTSTTTGGARVTGRRIN